MIFRPNRVTASLADIRTAGTFPARTTVVPNLDSAASRFRPRPLKWSPALIVTVAGIVAAALKIYCAATTFGSCDVTIICRFGQIVDSMGLDYMYRLDRHFNHPPVTGEFFGLVYHMRLGSPRRPLMQCHIRFRFFCACPQLLPTRWHC